MATYTLTTDADDEAAITAARELKNAGVDPEAPEYLADNAAYVAFVWGGATASYRAQKAQRDRLAALEA